MMRKWVVLFAVGIFILLANLDMTIVNLALAELAKDFFASLQQVQLIVVSYLAAAALFFCFAGKLADFFGKKNIFLVGAAFFVIASLLIGLFDKSINAIIITRFFQGIGFAATLGLAVILIVQAFPSEQKGFATGMAVTLTGLGLALGPPVGGIILQYFGWRWIFLMNVPLGVLSIILVYFYVTPDKRDASQIFKLDIVSIPLYFIGLSAFIFLLSFIKQLSNFTIGTLLFVGLLFLIIFSYRSLRVKYPLISITLLKNRGYLTILMIRMIFMFVMASFLFVLPLYMQNILHMSKFASGLWLLCMTACIAMISPLAGKLIDTAGYKLPILMSIIFLVLSCVAFFFLSAQLSILVLFLGLLMFGLSNGIHTPSTISGALSQVPAEYSGTAIGLFFTIAMIGAMSGVGITGLILEKISQHELMHHLLSQNLILSGAQSKILFLVADGSQSLQTWQSSFQDGMLSSLNTISSGSFVFALHYLMKFNLVLALIGFCFCVLLFRLKNNP